MKALLPNICLLILFGAASSIGAGTEVVVPKYDDKYSQLVKQLEEGHTNIDYAGFRSSFLESAQFKVAAAQHSELQDLRKKLHELMGKKSYPEIMEVTKKMLSIDYTDMEAHKILQQTAKIVGDEATRARHHDIEFGLLTSIVKKGDGKTCQTAWPVIQVEEEYFILQMIGAKLTKQSLDNNGGLCDKMEVQTPEGAKTYYFDVNKVFEDYNKQGLH